MVSSECPAWGKTYNSFKPNHLAVAEVCESGKSDVKSDKSDRKSKGSADYASGPKTPAKSSKPGKYAKKSESSDSSTEGSVSVVTDVSAIHNDKTRPLFCKMKIDDNVVVHQIDPGATVCPKKVVVYRYQR